MAESKFPMTFDKCPMCGCEETITQVAWAEEAEKGKVVKDTPVAAQHLQIPLMDPKKPPLLTVGILLIQADFCAGCGMLYSRNAQTITGQVNMGPPPGGKNGPGGLMPKGFG